MDKDETIRRLTLKVEKASELIFQMTKEHEFMLKQIKELERRLMGKP